jgi:hypothetical protein
LLCCGVLEKHEAHSHANLSCVAEQRRMFVVSKKFSRDMEHDKHLSAPSAVVVRGTKPRRKDPIEEDIAFCKLITLLSPRTSRVRTMPPSLIKKNLQITHSLFFCQLQLQSIHIPAIAATISTVTITFDQFPEPWPITLCNNVECFSGSGGF